MHGEKNSREVKKMREEWSFPLFLFLIDKTMILQCPKTIIECNYISVSHGEKTCFFVCLEDKFASLFELLVLNISQNSVTRASVENMLISIFHMRAKF